MTFTAYDVSKPLPATPGDDGKAYPFGILVDAAAAELHALADKIGAGEVILQTVEPSSNVAGDDFAMSKVVLTFHEPRDRDRRWPLQRATGDAAQILSAERENEFIDAINAKACVAPYLNLRNIIRLIALAGASTVRSKDLAGS
jgi:hypothetical protein